MRLVATNGNQTLAFPLREGSTLIGRHPSCHICIPATGISRRHCQLYVDNDTAVLRDLGSANATCVNGQPVERVVLRDGDVIALGSFQLRFELGTVPAQAAAGVATAAAAQEPPPQDTPMSPPAATGPHAEETPTPEVDGFPEGVPPPTDFPDSPDLDDTPVDADFVPQGQAVPPPGEPPQDEAHTALVVSAGVPMQPQLVVRDGRWYLRDPRTGREVEISPKGGEAAAVPAEGRRPNTRLLILGLAAAAALIVVFAAVFLKKPKPVRSTRPSQNQYNAMVNGAIKLLRDGKTDKALDALEKAHSFRPDIGVANFVREYIRLKQEHQDDLENFKWERGETLLENVIDVGYAPDDALTYAKEERDWIHNEQATRSDYAKIMAQLRSADDDDTLKDVLGHLERIPKETLAGKKAAGSIKSLRATLGQRLFGRANDAIEKRIWKQARQYLKQAATYLADHKEIKLKEQLCKVGDADEKAIARAEKALNEKDPLLMPSRFRHAREVLTPIANNAASPYRSDAQRLLRDIDDLIAAAIAAEKAEKDRRKKDEARRKAIAAQLAKEAREKKEREEQQRRVTQINDLYQQGHGEEACRLIDEYGFQDQLGGLKRRVALLNQYLKAGDQAKAERRYIDAIDEYNKVLAEESDAKNQYVIKAKTFIQAIKNKAAEYAQEFAAEGEKALVLGKAKEARARFDEAKRLAPTNADAIRGLKNLQRQAGDLHNRGSLLLDQGNPAMALELLKKALERVDPASELHAAIQKKIQTCNTLLGIN